MVRMLVVDDEPSICWGLEQLAKQLDYDVDTASSAEAGLELVAENHYDVVILDVRLPGTDGLTALPKIRDKLPETPVIMITAYGDLQTAVEAVRRGAFEYLVKPFDLDQVERTLLRALRFEPSVSRDTSQSSQAPEVDGLVGSSSAMQEIYRRTALVAPHDAGVLLHGESGTGKEVVARAIHRYSARSAGPFVAVNVASLSSSLAESELFGHVRGAFTGADQARTGLLVQANGGTLFLDEVADIPLPTQVKLLRSVERGEVTPVGSGESVKTDFRVISATHQDLLSRVQQNEFRHDLYYRLCTFQIDLPPLRERGDDIVLLAEYFLREIASRDANTVHELATDVKAELRQRSWHGNVRELRNAIEHAAILARGGVIQLEHLPAPTLPTLNSSEMDGAADIAVGIRRWVEQQLAADADSGDLYERMLELIEPPLLDVAIKHHHGQCAAAARSLGMHRTTVRKKLDHYGIQADS